MKRQQGDAGSQFEFWSSVLNSWLSEVRKEVDEAVGILSESGNTNEWWAERIRSRLQDDSPPDVSAALLEDRASTLLEIAFWSGWLKGELETLQRCNLMIGSGVGPRSRQTSLFVPAAARPAIDYGPACQSAANRIASAQRLVGEMDSKNYLPGAELVAIHLSSVIEGRASGAAGWIEAECFRSLEALSAEMSTGSLVALAFNSGMLAGVMLKEMEQTGQGVNERVEGGDG